MLGQTVGLVVVAFVAVDLVAAAVVGLVADAEEVDATAVVGLVADAEEVDATAVVGSQDLWKGVVSSCGCPIHVRRHIQYHISYTLKVSKLS